MQSNFNQMICCSSSFTTRILNYMYIFIFVILYVNCFCFQMLDMIMPKKLNVISLQDLKRCRMTPIFFDTFFNLEKYLDHEQRDPFASQRDVDEDGNEVRKRIILNMKFQIGDVKLVSISQIIISPQIKYV